MSTQRVPTKSVQAAADADDNAVADATESRETEPTGSIVGRFAHVVIGTLLERGVRSWRPGAALGLTEVVSNVVNELPLDQVRSAHPYAVSQQLVTGAAIYFRLFGPSAEWSFAGREVTAPGCRFDVVFYSTEGSVFVDQIKTGRIEQRLELDSLHRQVREELRAGNERWPGKFQGVRTVILGAPRRSQFIYADGTVAPIRWDGCDEL